MIERGTAEGVLIAGKGAAHIHLNTIERVLEQAQACILGETPEIGSHEEARVETLERVRSALLQHIPAVRRGL